MSLIPKTSFERDPGVIIDGELKFTYYYESIVSKASKVVGLIRRNFTLSDLQLFSTLFKSLVGPIIEYGHTTIKPHLQKDIDAFEKIQRRASKSVQKLRGLCCCERLEKLALPSISYRLL